MNYIIRVENKSEWRDVLAHYKKAHFEPSNIDYKYKLFISDDKFEGYNPYSGTDSNYGASTRVSYAEWKEIVSPKALWKVGDIVLSRAGSNYEILDKDDFGKYSIKSIKYKDVYKDYSKETITQFIKEGAWTVIEQTKTNNMNTKEYFSAQGSKFIKKALIEQLESEGFKSLTGTTKRDVIEYNMALGITKYCSNKEFLSINESNSSATKKYTLPQDYDAALEAFRNFYKEEGFKVGDWAITTKAAETYLYHPEVGFVFQIESVDGDNLEYLEFSGARYSGAISAKRCRKATDAEIAEAQKPKEKVVRVSASNGAFDVTVSKGKIMAEGKPVLASELRKLVADSDLSGWVVSARTFDIGCKRGVTRESIREIVQEYDKLNG